jgi:hypothetical protein
MQAHVQGGRVAIHGGEMPSGVYPMFANTGRTRYYYWVTASDGSGWSNLLYAGSDLTSGAGTIPVTFPVIAGATNLVLLRDSSTNGYQAPYGKGNWDVGGVVKAASACANRVSLVISRWQLGRRVAYQCGRLESH